VRTARGAGRRFAVDRFLFWGARRDEPFPARLVLRVERAVEVLERLR